MQAGRLKYVIEIYQPITQENDFGEDSVRWEKKISTRAAITYSSGSRTNDNDEVFYDYTIVFEVRKYHKISEFDRIYFRDKKYRILSIEPSVEKQNQTIRTEIVNE